MASKAQIKKFQTGYNEFIRRLNNNISTQSSPYRGASWDDLGYSFARSDRLGMQVQGLVNSIPKEIDEAKAAEMVKAMEEE